MIYNDKISKTEEQMLDIIEVVKSLDEPRFIASLYVRSCSPIDIDIKLAEVRRCLAYTHREALSLAKLELTYNKDFSVIDNKRFTTAERMFNRLRSSMACLRKTIRKSCPISHKIPYNPNFHPSIFNRSVLTKGCCARDLYGIDTFDDNVKALYYEQQALFANVILSLSICWRVIKDEKEIGKSPEQCIQRLVDQCQRIINDIRDVLDMTKEIPMPEIQRLINDMGLDKFATQHFHKIPLTALKEYAIYLEQQKIKDSQFHLILSNFFKDEQKGKDAKLLAEHFDDVLHSNRRKMDSLKIRLFCNWCAGGKIDNPKDKYYTFLLQAYQGKHTEFAEWHAVTTSKSRKGIDMNAEQKTFNKEVDDLLRKLKNNRTDVA
jgi:hypothetical protein